MFNFHTAQNKSVAVSYVSFQKKCVQLSLRLDASIINSLSLHHMVLFANVSYCNVAGKPGWYQSACPLPFSALCRRAVKQICGRLSATRKFFSVVLCCLDSSVHSRCVMTPLQPQSSQPRHTPRRNSHAEAHLGRLDSGTISWTVNYGKQSDRCSALGTFVAPICLIYLHWFRFHPAGMGVAVSGRSSRPVILRGTRIFGPVDKWLRVQTIFKRVSTTFSLSLLFFTGMNDCLNASFLLLQHHIPCIQHAHISILT